MNGSVGVPVNHNRVQRVVFGALKVAARVKSLGDQADIKLLCGEIVASGYEKAFEAAIAVQ
ncbi:MAG: hypothetical protein PHV71_04180 [Eubacteriales bacterium]|nr:hypothetical protein [Eubacteriales bacterium]MDD4629788.1 hypothetical protein [Eubacteriales bacterium]